MNKRKPSLTIAIPAFNEAKNIGYILDSLARQKYTKVKLDQIIVYTDGSTDKTPEIVKEKIKKIPDLKLIAGKNQLGKFYRLNQIYKANNSDVLIILDADIGIPKNDFIENFAMSIINDKKAQLVSAHELPILPKDFVGRVIAATYTMWDQVRWSIPKCDHVQNLYNRATAYRGSFAKTLYIPDKATEERLYLYLMAKEKNGYRYTHNAQILYIPVNTVYDYIKLSDRAFGRPQPAVNKLVGYDATFHYNIPRKYKIIGMLKSFIRDPFYTTIAFFMGIWLSHTVLNRQTADSQIWEISTSSKKEIIL